MIKTNGCTYQTLYEKKRCMKRKCLQPAFHQYWNNFILILFFDVHFYLEYLLFMYHLLHATMHLTSETLALPSNTDTQIYTDTDRHRHTPGHGWLGGCSRCRGKSFAQGRGSDRSQNPYHSAHHCTAPTWEGKGRKTELSKYRKRSVKAKKTSQLKHLKFSVGRGWLESKPCMSNCHHKAFVDNYPTPYRDGNGGE